MRKTVEKFIEDSKRVHGDKYDYSKVEYVNASTKVCIICLKHGEFWQAPKDHLNGQGCPECGGHMRKTVEKFIEDSKRVHGDKYDYSKVEYVNNKTKVCIICPKHGEFFVTPHNHLKGRNCPLCGAENKRKKRADTTESFVEKAIKVHGDKYDYSKVEYVNQNVKVCIICPEHGEFWQTPSNHINPTRPRDCPKCHAITSKKEDELYDFLCKLVGDDNVVRNSRDVISPLELDMYIPSLSIAVEFDGLRWHSEEFEPSPSYHLNKTKMCEEKGIRLLHVFEDEWDFKKDVIKNILRTCVGVNDTIYARKCEVREISPSDAKEFINVNHIQNYVPSKINIGLFNEDSLVSVMCFGGLRKNLGQSSKEGSYEMLRYATMLGCTVIGGASKLFKYFKDRYNPEFVKTYADKRLFSGKVYESLGFVLEHTSQPNYFYVIGSHRENRFKYRKDRLVSEGFDKDKTEHQIMLDRGIFRIYDCGCNVYEWKSGALG